nr:uncharacterized protein LOC111509962 [Leptinotarsa decemlineata]
MKTGLVMVFMMVSYISAHEFDTELITVSPQEYLAENVESRGGLRFDTKLAETISADLPPDNGGNYGDLIYKFRENKDTLLLREVVITDQLSSYEQNIRWTVSISGAQVTSVRVLNFGRSRAYCLRIDVAAGDVQIFLRVPVLGDPRVMIEVYGY